MLSKHLESKCSISQLLYSHISMKLIDNRVVANQKCAVPESSEVDDMRQSQH